jgi:hypothetical protein
MKLIKTLKNWYLDLTFSDQSYRNCVEVRNVFHRRANHHPACDLDPTVVEWLRANVDGRCWYDGSPAMVGPLVVAEDITLLVWFSRVEDAIKFKLTFSC